MKLKLAKKRFIKMAIIGFLAGAVQALTSLTYGNVTNWSDARTYLYSFIFALFTGGLVGIIAATEKFLQTSPEDVCTGNCKEKAQAKRVPTLAELADMTKKK
jgi:formate/nitrite transporter FocA (FNT family)